MEENATCEVPENLLWFSGTSFYHTFQELPNLIRAYRHAM
jgi:hypothetical protein